MSDEMQKYIFIRNLKKYLEENGKTQKDVAEAIGVSPQTFNTWIVGIALPRMGKIQKLADYFGINKSDLIEDKESENQLNNVSKSLLSKFSQLTPANKTTIMSMIDVLLSQQDSSKEIAI